MYLALKSLHILVVVLFLGNIITGVFWKMIADRTADPRIMAFTLDGIIRSDRVFTIPGVILIVVFGVGAASVGHFPLLSTKWILHSLILFSISGLAFMFRVAPLQRQMRAVAQAAIPNGKLDEAAYGQLSTQWNIWGGVATLTPLAAMVLMVLKPGG